MNLCKIQSNYAIALLLTIVLFSCIIGLMLLMIKTKLVLFAISYMIVLALLTVYLLVLW